MEEEEHYEKKHPFDNCGNFGFGLLLTGCGGESSSQVHSVLDDIEGIGPARRKALMRRYQSLEKIKEADVEDLMQTETMNEKAAQAVYAFFHSAT